jgi:hypothetical protein
VIDDDGMFMRLEPNSREAVHVMAMHLEYHSQYGGMALDAGQAEQISNALRTVAETADMNALAYNHMCEQLEERIYRAERWRNRLEIAGAVLLVIAFFGLVSVIL